MSEDIDDEAEDGFIPLWQDLAAQLELAADATPDQVHAEIRRRLHQLAQERDTAIALAAAAQAELQRARENIQGRIDAEVAHVRTVMATDALIANAYRDGKLIGNRERPSRFEPMLRQLAEHSGVAALEAELAALPQVVPLGQRPLDDAKEPPPTVFADSIPVGEDGLTDDEREVAQQLNLEPEQMLATKRALRGAP